MSGRLEGLTVFVTAAGAGIGLAAARACWRDGATVWATDRTPGKMPDQPADERWRVRRLDVTDDAGLRAAIAEAGAIDVLFSNAGWVPHGTIVEASEEDWRRAFEVNVRSMFVLIRAALPGMIERGGGRIITMASVVSSIKAARSRAVYGASKAAVIGLTKSIAGSTSPIAGSRPSRSARAWSTRPRCASASRTAPTQRPPVGRSRRATPSGGSLRPRRWRS